MPRSYLDGADLARLRAAAGREGGTAALLLACLLEGGVVQHDPDDPDWADRDRLLVDPALPLVAVAGAARRAGYALEEGRLGQGPGRAVDDAVRAAGSSAAAGDVYRVFLLLDAASLADGRVWEGLVAAGRTGLAALVALVPDERDPAPRHPPPPGAAATLRAAGWRVTECAAEPAEVLAALDHLLAPADPPCPAAVVVRSA